MSRHWTRAHDAHIARVCEGLELTKIPHSTSDRMVFKRGDFVHEIPHYNTDLLAAFRALEAWRLADKENREYVLYSPAPNDGSGKLVVISHGRQYWSTLADLPAAIAWALYDATGGAQ